jgi:hypothetical protein
LNDGGKNKRDRNKNKLFFFVMWVRIRWLRHTHTGMICVPTLSVCHHFQVSEKITKCRENRLIFCEFDTVRCVSGWPLGMDKFQPWPSVVIFNFSLKEFWIHPKKKKEKKTTNRCVQSSYDAHHQRQVERRRKELFKQMTSWPTRHDATGGGDDYDVLCVIQSIY